MKSTSGKPGKDKNGSVVYTQIMPKNQKKHEEKEAERTERVSYSKLYTVEARVTNKTDVFVLPILYSCSCTEVY